MKHVPAIFKTGLLLAFIAAALGFLCRYLGLNDRALAFAVVGMVFLAAAALEPPARGLFFLIDKKLKLCQFTNRPSPFQCPAKTKYRTNA